MAIRACHSNSDSGDGPSTKHRHFAANQPPVARPRDLPLQRHQPALAIINRTALHFPVQRKAGAGLLIGIGEHAQPVELGGLDKLDTTPRNRPRSRREIRQSCWCAWRRLGWSPDPLDELQKLLAVSPRFMRLSTSRLACCSGMSMYFTSAACAGRVFPATSRSRGWDSSTGTGSTFGAASRWLRQPLQQQRQAVLQPRGPRRNWWCPARSG